MPPRQPPRVAPVTLSRRSLLEWLGRSVVVGLGAELLRGCAPGDDLGAGGDGGRPDGRGLDAGHDAPPAEVPCDAGAGAFPFAPGTLEPPRPEWRINTVDQPDLAALLAGWRLTVDGLCERPQSFAFADLLCLARQDQVTDFHCVEGWSVYDVPWNGLHLQTLLDLVAPRPAATYVTFHTQMGRYNESLPLSVALEARTLLGYGVGGHTLPLEHGFPLRLVVPRLLGYKNAKYVERLELTDAPVEGFWVRAGYPYAGEVPPARLREGKY